MYIGNTNKRRKTAPDGYVTNERATEGGNGADMQKSRENTAKEPFDNKAETGRSSDGYENRARRKISLPSPPPNYGGVLYREDGIPDIEPDMKDEKNEAADGETIYAEGLTRLARSDRSLRRRRETASVPASSREIDKHDCECDAEKKKMSGFEALINGLSHNNFSASDILFGAVILLMLSGDCDDDMLLILVLMLLL